MSGADAAWSNGSDTDDGPVWLSIGDLMSALLMIFVLLFVAALLQLRQVVETAEQRRVLVIQALKEQLDAHGIEARIDEVTGDVSITNDILFALNSSVISPEGRRFLDEFIPVYASVVFSDPTIEEEVVRVIIEGHTSSLGAFGPNMSLSLARAQAVSSHVVSMSDFPRKEQFLHKLMPSGRGEIEANQEVDAPGDRRVLFRFQFKGDHLEVWAGRLSGDEEAR